MGIMNSLGRGISAAANAGSEIYARGAAIDQQNAASMKLEDQRAAVLRERDARLEEQGIRAETRKNEPLNRISQNAQSKMAEEVPLEATPVTSLSGVNEAGKKFGFQGDLKTVRAELDRLPDSADKTAALAQLEGQIKTDTKTGLINVAGKTRKRTADEALDAAVQDAKLGDLPAYADYEARVGKPLREERRIDVTESRNQSAAAAAARDSERKEKAADRRDETQRYIAELRDNTAQARIEALIKNSGGGASGTKEALNFIDGARKELANDAANLKAMYAADTKDAFGKKLEEVKAEYKPKQEAIEAKRAQIEKDFDALREKVGLPAADSRTPNVEKTPPAPKPNNPAAAQNASPYPDGTKLTGPGGKPYIVRNGKPVPA